MAKFLKANKWLILAITLISLLYFGLRLPNLTLQPIFADEAIYIRWAQVMRAEPTLRFLPLSDGKTPLFMWMMIPFFKIFDDPLFAGRFLSVLSGFLTVAGAFFLGWKFFNRNIGIWMAFLVTITPYFVFFDRMALVDSMLAAFSIWSLNLGLLLIKYPRFDLAMCLGYLFGGAMLVKTPGYFNMLMFPVLFLTLNFKKGIRENQLFKILLMGVIAFGIGIVIYNILRLGLGFDNLSSRNQDYIHSPSEILNSPLDPLIPHIRDLSDWFVRLLTIPILLLVVIGIVLGFIKKQKIILTILFWATVPVILQMMFLKTFTARYLLFSIPPLVCLGGWAFDNLITFGKFKKEYVAFSLMCLLLLFSLNFNLKLLLAPETAPLPKMERHGYFEDWTAGYGLKEIAQFLEEKSNSAEVVVGTEGSFGTLPDGLQIYLDKNRKITVIGGGPMVEDNLRQAALDHPTYFVANKVRYPKPQTGVVLIKEYPKAQGDDGFQDAILLFEVKNLEK